MDLGVGGHIGQGVHIDQSVLRVGGLDFGQICDFGHLSFQFDHLDLCHSIVL